MPIWFKILLLMFGAILAWVAFRRFIPPVQKFITGAWELVARAWQR